MHSILRRTGAVSHRWRALLRGRPIPLIFAAAGVVSFLVFAWFARDGFDPASSAGIGFGIAAAVLLLVVMVYSVRRSLPSVRALGPTRPYLEAHLYGGLFFLLLVLMHTGFGLPSGALTTSLWVVSLWVVLSGVVGRAFQVAIPRLLQAETALEVHVKRIPELAEDVRTRAAEAAREAGPRVESFYERELAPEMAAVRSDLGVLAARGRTLRRRANDFEHLERIVGPDGAESVAELRQMHRTKLDLDLHNTVQWILRMWLVLHLPLAIVLIALFVLHVFFILYF